MSSSNYNKRTILVIEDDKSISSFICTALQSSGYTVLTAADGRAGKTDVCFARARADTSRSWSS